MRKTKIICTIGPTSASEDVLRQMILAGMNVARLNFSHSHHADHLEKINLIKKLRKEIDVPLAILLDTKGIEIRLRNFKKGSVSLKAGDIFTLTTRKIIGDEKNVSVDYPKFCKTVKKGGRVLVDDGLCEFRILKVTEKDVVCEVMNDGVIGDKKSVNLPGAKIEAPFLSKRDKEDLLFGIKHEVDYIALSFTRTAADVNTARRFLKKQGGEDIDLIAKIENEEGVENIDEIITVSDGVMIARGDMGVEIPFEDLPHIQKKIITGCYTRGKKAITATQMLESMIENPRPTRAEITDVANAVYDGTSAVMLSGETSIGKYPVRTIETIAKIAERTESTINYKNIMDRNFRFEDYEANIVDAISHATCATAHSLSADAIVAVTLSGKTARMISRFRPQTQIIAVTPFDKTYQKLAMTWGVMPVMNTYVKDADGLIKNAVEAVEAMGGLVPGDLIVITGNTRYSSGDINSLQVYILGEDIG